MPYTKLSCVLSLTLLALAGSPAISQTAAPAQDHATNASPQLESGPVASGRWTLRQVGNAPTPPMGWNSWNAFGPELNEEKVLGAAQAIVDNGLADLGYRYINLDDGWWLQRRQSDGRLLVRTNLFPSAAVGGRRLSSFRPFTDKLHAMGLLAGIYTDIGRNACSQISNRDSANLPTGTIAEKEVGLHGHVAQDLELFFGEWQFDYVKVDACGIAAYDRGGRAEQIGGFNLHPRLISNNNVNQTDIPAVKAAYGEVRDVLTKLRPDGDFVLSLCAWGAANSRAWGKDFSTIWRTSADIKPDWGRMLHSFDTVATRELYAGPGRWNDPDMLQIGNGEFDENHPVEARSHLSLWAITAAPLLIGYDMRRASPVLLDILGAPEIIAINQDKSGNQGVLAFSSDEKQIIVKQLASRGSKGVALFNRTSQPLEIVLKPEHLKLSGDTVITLRDLWAREEIGELGKERVFTLAPRETKVLLAKGNPVAPTGYHLSEMPARIHVADDGLKALEADPSIYLPQNAGSNPDNARAIYAGWGNPRADATPYGESLRIRDVTYRYGLGVMAGSVLEVKNQGQFARFSATVGVDDSTRGKTAQAVFEVYGDGKLLEKSRPLRFNDEPQRMNVDVSNVDIVELIVRQVQSDHGSLIAVWGDAQLN